MSDEALAHERTVFASILEVPRSLNGVTPPPVPSSEPGPGSSHRQVPLGDLAFPPRRHLLPRPTRLDRDRVASSESFPTPSYHLNLLCEITTLGSILKCQGMRGAVHIYRCWDPLAGYFKEENHKMQRGGWSLPGCP